MGIYLLGMHRSGTSALARTLGVIVGYDMPPEARPHNPEGHWEDRELRAANEALLRAAGGDWSAPPDDVAGALPVDRAREPGNPYTANVARLGSGPWVWKDPRNCLTLPLWLAADPADPVFVMSVRHPLEVATSLQRRNCLPLLYGVALWERYNRAMVSALYGREAFLVTYDGLVRRPAETVTAQASWLRGQGVLLQDDPVRLGVSAVRTPLRHATEPDDDDHLAAAGLSKEQIALYRSLASRHCRGATVGADWLPPRETPTTSDMLATRRQLLDAFYRARVWERRRRTPERVRDRVLRSLRGSASA